MAKVIRTKKVPRTKRTGADQKTLDKKWTVPVMKAGYTVIPSVLLARQQAIGLDATDMNILLHIMRHWWEADALP